VLASTGWAATATGKLDRDDYAGATELFECPASDPDLCETMASLLLWYGYGLTRVAEQPKTREAIERIMSTHAADATPVRRWTSATTCVMQSLDLLLTSLEHCYPPPLKRLHYSHKLCLPYCVWGPWELHGLARALTELRVQLPELEQMLVAIARTWDQGDPVQWPTTAKLLIAQHGCVPQLTCPIRGWDYDAAAFNTLNR
jgi:hypothetical protein